MRLFQMLSELGEKRLVRKTEKYSKNEENAGKKSLRKSEKMTMKNQRQK